ncbi:MAG: SRPBCC family protein [Pseudomonadota bacterium]
MMKYRLVFVSLIAASLAACAPPAPPTEPVAWFDPPDLLADEKAYVVSIATTTVPMSPEELRAFLVDQGSLLVFMEPVGSIAPPVGQTAIEGVWPDEGARRRLIQQDGHQLLERSLKNETSDFRYQAFGFTSGIGRGVDHIYADWSLTPVEGGTQFDWTYRLAPKHALARIVVRRTRDNALQPFMQGTLDRMTLAAQATKSGPVTTD